ncbi:MAG: HAD-IA family hydrolase [Devosia sp.]
MPPRLILFDCDGTLIDSQATIVAAMADAFTGSGLQAPTPAAVRSIIGLSLQEAMVALTGKTTHAKTLADAYREAHRARVTGEGLHEPPFEGMVETLKALNDPHSLMGVVTGKSRRGLDRVLRVHDIGHHFIVTVTADEAASKPSPDMVFKAMGAAGGTPERTVVVGDTTFDVEMAKAAGTHAIGVSWGYHPTDALLDAGATHVATTMDALRDLVDALLPPAAIARGT